MTTILTYLLPAAFIVSVAWAVFTSHYNISITKIK